MSDGLDAVGGWEALAEAIERDEEAFSEVMAAAVARRDEPGARLLALIEACVAECDWEFWIELWSHALRDERARELRARLEGAFRGQIAQVIGEGVEAGAFDVADVEQATLAIATTIDALAVEATLEDDIVSPNFMFGACALFASRIVGSELRILDRSTDA